jgi:hypothetical protein
MSAGNCTDSPFAPLPMGGAPRVKVPNVRSSICSIRAAYTGFAIR